jgi:Zn-finger nucleic acid-binding protein
MGWKSHINNKLFARVPHTKTRKDVHINMCPETLNLWVIAERVHLQKVLKMSSVRFNSRLDTPHHGPSHPFKDAGAVADSLPGIHNTMLKCFFVVNRIWIHKGFNVSPQVKIQRIKIWRARRSCSGSSPTHTSVLICVTENISHSTAKMCRSTITHVPHSCSEYQ